MSSLKFHKFDQIEDLGLEEKGEIEAIWLLCGMIPEDDLDSIYSWVCYFLDWFEDPIMNFLFPSSHLWLFFTQLVG
jgi:hypothetical protein